ncbi:hypothetical protein Lal_00003036 [Lupinus albus]|uniref:Uncharacterized protein n=1 Tax=Lupinus albus TaxID=3870 RepID=A0A6A5NMM5_LUPAL|nr:hypothetical protein Lalb_Chr22g0352321 [Lupinus albus]KAF1882855.1 hypothetical protein Lal_00003036 [Lupinus albus]
MAHINNNIIRGVFFIVFIVGFLLAAEARSQGDEFSQAPAPEPDVGAGFVVTYSRTFICSSLFISLLLLIFH